jgi:hypothetical protein
MMSERRPRTRRSHFESSFLSAENRGEGRVYAFFRGTTKDRLWAYSDNPRDVGRRGASFLEIPDKPKVYPT